MRDLKQGKVLQHLQKYGSITQLEAFEQYKAMRLAVIINRLRQTYRIDTVMETDPNTLASYARYYFRGEKNVYEEGMGE